MKKLLISASLVALAFPATAQAQAYIGVSGGVITNENADNDGLLADSVAQQRSSSLHTRR